MNRLFSRRLFDHLHKPRIPFSALQLEIQNIKDNSAHDIPLKSILKSDDPSSSRRRKLYVRERFVQRAKEIDSSVLSSKIIESYRTRGGVPIEDGLFLHLKQKNSFRWFVTQTSRYMFSRRHWKEALTILDARREFISPLQFIAINRGFVVTLYDGNCVGAFSLGDHDVILTNDAARMRHNAKNAKNILSKTFWRYFGEHPVFFYTLLFKMSNPRYVTWFVVLTLGLFACLDEFLKTFRVLDEIEADFKNNLAPEVCLTDQYWWDLSPNETARQSQAKIIEGRRSLELFARDLIDFQTSKEAKQLLHEDCSYADDKYIFRTRFHFPYMGVDDLPKLIKTIHFAKVKGHKVKTVRIIHEPDRMIVRFSRKIKNLSDEIMRENSLFVFHLAPSDDGDDEQREKIWKIIYNEQGKFVMNPEGMTEQQFRNSGIEIAESYFVQNVLVARAQLLRGIAGMRARWDYVI